MSSQGLPDLPDRSSSPAWVNPEPSSQYVSSDPAPGASQVVDFPADKKYEEFERCRLDPSHALAVLRACKPAGTQVMLGWCDVVDMAPTKEDGYVQVSHCGVNKFASLQTVVLLATGLDHGGQGFEASHLCHRPKCRTVGHVVTETASQNNARKNCLVWVDCHHCAAEGAQKIIFVCPHLPRCIKFKEGFASPEELAGSGAVCHDVFALPRA